MSSARGGFAMVAVKVAVKIKNRKKECLLVGDRLHCSLLVEWNELRSYT